MTIRLRVKLTVKHLKAVIDNLYYARTDDVAYEAFGQLELVKRKIESWKHLVVSRKSLREFAVCELLDEIIRCELQQQRSLFHIAHRSPADLETRDQAIHDIRQDAQSNAPYLIGWSLFYHLYSRPDLSLSHGEFADLVHTDNRTLLRYKQQTLQHLWRQIIQMEIQLSESQKRKKPSSNR